ncbi:MAG: UbiA family prenyltransferase [Minisyncoccia bacterium]
MEKLRLYARSVPITFESWFISLAGVVVIRTFFEQFPSFQPGHFVLIDAPTIVHYGVSYLAINISLMLILMLFGRRNLHEVSVVCTFGLLIILIAPIIDVIFAGIGGQLISYFFMSGQELLWSFVTFFGWNITSGITLGIQVETFMGIIFCLVYVYTIKRSVWRALGAGFAFYCLIFFIFSLPSLLALALPQNIDASFAVMESLMTSNILPNNIHPNFTANDIGLVDLAFNKLMIGANLVVAVISGMLLFFVGTREKFKAMMKNTRPERIFHFFLLYVFGSSLIFTAWPANWIDVASYLFAFFSIVCAWMYSVCQNDIYDEKIDSISNAGRPIIAKELSRSDMETASKIFLLLTFLFAYASSHYAIFFVSMFLFVYYIYSNPPLRLKRFVLVNSFLVSLACLSVIMLGFFMISPDKSIVTFPLGLIVAIVIFFTAVTNIRDIKDFEGDKVDGIKTLPVLLGLGRAQKLIAGTICFFFLLIPWYFEMSFLWMPSIVASLLSWYFITQKNYKEWKGFFVYMAYLIFIIGVMIIT